MEILDGIGSAEMFHIYISNYLDDVTEGSLGKLVPGYDAEIVDDRDIVHAVAESTYERYTAEQSGPLNDDTRPFLHAYVAKRVAVLLDVVDTASWDHAKLQSAT